MSRLKITLVRSTIGRLPRQRKTVQALGLRRLRHTVFHDDTPQIRGMIGAVAHLVDWDLVEE
ncbi:MAG: 50S ribosomal protein L30 [Thermovirgaceae bacterium]|nr:50S ribosomal protein L30 [Thermovirgaceae bacterium]